MARSSYMGVFLSPVCNDLSLKLFRGPLVQLAHRLGKPDYDLSHYRYPLNLLHLYKQTLKKFFYYRSRKRESLLGETKIIHTRSDPFLIPSSDEELRDYFSHFSLTLMDGKHYPFHYSPEKIIKLLESEA